MLMFRYNLLHLQFLITRGTIHLIKRYCINVIVAKLKAFITKKSHFLKPNYNIYIDIKEQYPVKDSLQFMQR